MIRTQIQLPNDVYERAKRLSEEKEISLAELARRGLEYILSVYSAGQAGAADWAPPAPQHLGWKGLSERELKEQSRQTSAERSMSRGRRSR